MVWLGVQSGKKKCPKAFEEISSFIARWWPECFLSCKKGIQNLLRKKKKYFYGVLLDKLISSMKNQKDLWESVHKIAPKRKSFYNNISLKSWFKHFRALLQKEFFILFWRWKCYSGQRKFSKSPNFQGRSLACIQKVDE